MRYRPLILPHLHKHEYPSKSTTILIISQTPNAKKRKGPTKVVGGVARTTPKAPQFLLGGTVCERGVLVPDLAEEVYAVRSPE